jgi:tetratricopeptide (TPR) repeat protein
MNRDDLLQKIAEQDAVVERRRESGDVDAQQDVCHALLSRGRLLGELGSVEEAMEQFADVRKAFAESDDEFLRACSVASWVSEGYLLGELDRREAALAAYDQAILLAGGSGEPLLQEQTISAHHRKALALRAAGRYDEAAEVVAEVMNTFVPVPPPGVAPEVLAPRDSLAEIAGAFLLFPLLAGDLGQSDRTIPMYDKMIEVFGDQEDAGVQEMVGRARLSKAAVLGRSGQLTEAIEVCHEVLMSIDARGEPTSTALRALSLSDRGHWLKKAGRNEEAAVCFREVVDCFHSGQDDEIDEALYRAQQGLAAA